MSVFGRISLQKPVLSQKVGEQFRQFFDAGRLRHTLPHGQHLPARAFQFHNVAPVALHVRASLRPPELRVRPRHHPPIRAVMHVEETAVDEDDFTAAREYGSAR